MQLSGEIGSIFSATQHRQQKPPWQTWRTFLENHADCIAGIDFFTVHTATFRILYEFIVLSHDRRHIVHFNVKAHATARWTAQQVVEAFPFDSAPQYLLRDRDAIYGEKVRRRIKSLGIKDVLTARARLGKILSLKELSGPYAETVWIILLFSINGTCVESFASTSAIIILGECTYR